MAGQVIGFEGDVAMIGFEFEMRFFHGILFSDGLKAMRCSANSTHAAAGHAYRSGIEFAAGVMGKDKGNRCVAVAFFAILTFGSSVRNTRHAFD